MPIDYKEIFTRIQLSSYVLRIVTFFLILCSIPSLIFGLYLSIIRMDIISGFKMAIVGAIIGTSLTLAIGLLLDIFEKIKCYIKYGIIDFRVCQERRIVIEGDYDETVSKLANTLAKFKGISITKKDLKGGIIKAEIKRSWRSLGEKLELKLFNRHDKIIIILTSKPKLWAALFDFSKNLENLEIIMRGLKK